MKINRIVSLLLTLALMLSASAFASSLQWDFSTGSDTGSSFSQDTYTYEYVYSDFVMITGGNCHVRSMPDLNGTSLGVLYEGQTAHCLGGQSTDYRGVVWYEVDFNGMSGWVSSKYARLNGVGVVSYVTITDGKCYMRFLPNLNAEIIMTLQEGTRATYQGSVATDDRGVDWYYVSYDGEEGWVSSVYAKFGSTSSSSSSSSSSGYVKATSYKVNMRDEPNLSGKDIGTMNEGETATYLGKKSTDSRGVVWYKVRFEGKTGWVSSRYTKLYN